MEITPSDVDSIRRLSRKRAVKRISSTLLKKLNPEMLARLMAAYIVLKSNGHPDSDFVKYLVAKESRSIFLGIGFNLLVALSSSLLSDSEFRKLCYSLVAKNRGAGGGDRVRIQS